jgi:hypothetical protein
MKRNPHTIAALLLLAGLGTATGRCATPSTVADAAGPEEPVTGGLAATVGRVGAATRGPVWLAWEVAATPSLRAACCFDHSFRGAVCHLEGRDQGWGSNGKERGSGRMQVFVRWSDGKIGRVRAMSAECRVDPGGVPLVRLTGVAPAESVALVAGLVDRADRADRRHDIDDPLSALAFQADPSAEAALERFAAAGQPEERREQALFWIGQARGEEGARFLGTVVRGDPDSDIRKKAIFSLSQNDSPSAVPAIVTVARRDGDPDVRADALFWLAQTGDDGAPKVLLEALDHDPSHEVREKAIFAMSQLEHSQGVPLLVRVVREHREPEIRKQALFWLGQSEDPRALDFLEKLLSQ